MVHNFRETLKCCKTLASVAPLLHQREDRLQGVLVPRSSQEVERKPVLHVKNLNSSVVHCGQIAVLHRRYQMLCNADRLLAVTNKRRKDC